MQIRTEVIEWNIMDTVPLMSDRLDFQPRVTLDKSTFRIAAALNYFCRFNAT